MENGTGNLYRKMTNHDIERVGVKPSLTISAPGQSAFSSWHHAATKPTSITQLPAAQLSRSAEARNLGKQLKLPVIGATQCCL